MAVAKGMAELQGEVEEGKADRIVTAELRRRVALLEEEEVANGVKRAEGQVKWLFKYYVSLNGGVAEPSWQKVSAFGLPPPHSSA